MLIASHQSAPRIAALALLLSLLLTACSGGGGSGGNGSGGGGNSNVAPVANAGVDQTVTEQTAVQLQGSATDANAGDTLTYAWTQTSGSVVTLSNANQLNASFTAPEAQPNAPVIMTFQLSVTDSGGLTGSDSVTVTAVEAGSVVEISGKAEFEFVPPNPNCVGLSFAMSEVRPIRRATIQLLNASTDAVLSSGVTGDNGSYAFTVAAATDVYLRVRAELKRSGAPAWDVEVRNNTADTGAPLQQRPIYVLDGTAFNSGGADQTRNLLASTGWGGTSYSGPRAAAPFAVLDSIYSAMKLVLTADSTATFAPLDAYWSVNNSPAEGTSDDTDVNIANGELGTSFYRGDIDSLFLLGKANEDTEEFDDHVIVHEWGHYFEDVFSRSDSIGGAHGLGDKLDMRVAFGEGWATALSGMALNNATYCDTQGNRQANGFRIDIESGSSSPRGWYNEFSVMALVFDLWDDTVELNGGDTGSVPFASIFNTMTDRQRTTAAHTSIFSFMQGLIDEDSSSMALLNDLRGYHNISGDGIYGVGETNDGGSQQPDDALPVYTEISPNGTLVNICSNREHDTNEAVGNRLSEHRFLRMTIAVPSRYQFDIATDAATLAQLPPDDPNDPIDQSDPDLYFYLNGNVQNAVVGGQPQGLSGDANRETFTTPGILQPGNYVMDVVEFRHRDPDTDRSAGPAPEDADSFPDRSCFDMTIQPAP